MTLFSWVRALAVVAGLTGMAYAADDAANPPPSETFPVSITGAHAGQFFEPGEAIELTISVTNPLASEQSLDAEVQLNDCDGKTLDLAKTTLKPAAGGQASFPVRFASPGYGYYRTAILVTPANDPAGASQRHEESLGVLAKAQPRDLLPDSPFGVIAQLNRSADDEVEAKVQLMARAGVRWAREGFLWEFIEPTEGQFDWSHYDNIVETCHRYGISVLGVLAYGTDWASTAPPDQKRTIRQTTVPRMEAWKHFVEAVVQRYHDRIGAWEIWNEPNSTTFFHVQPDASQAQSYAQLLASAYGVIKQIDPKARVLNGGFTPKHWIKEKPELHEALFMDTIYQCSPMPFDVAATHPYTAPRLSTTNRQSAEKLERLAAFVRDPMVAHGEAAKPMWFTEFGVPIQEGIMTEQLAADYLVVMMTHSLSLNYVEKAFWYNLRDNGTDPKNKEHHFGLLNYDGTPKQAYFAYRTLTSLLEGARFVERRPLEGIGMYVFASPSQQVLVAWSDDSETRQISVRSPAGNVQVRDITGRVMDLPAHDGQVTVPVTPRPCFVVAPITKD